VQIIISRVATELGGLSNIAVREDVIRPMRGERPPRIGGYTPDVYATDVPTTRTVVGEAKTQLDLETEHSRRQITAFLGHLSRTPGGTFILAVPPSARATARRQLAHLCAIFGDDAPRIIVLDGSEPITG
jgi:hypothetical protein